MLGIQETNLLQETEYPSMSITHEADKKTKKSLNKALANAAIVGLISGCSLVAVTNMFYLAHRASSSLASTPLGNVLTMPEQFRSISRFIIFNIETCTRTMLHCILFAGIIHCLIDRQILT